MPIAEAYRGGFWLFATYVANSAFGLAYWLVMSRLVGAEALGYAAVVVSAAALATGLASLGITTGQLRHVGEAAGKGDHKEASTYTWTALAYLAAAYTAAGVVAATFTPHHFAAAVVVAVLIGASAAFDTYLAAIYKTDVKFAAAVAGGVAKIAMGVTLAGWGWVGAVAGFLTGNAVSAAIVTAYALRRLAKTSPTTRHLKEMAKAGVAVWTPTALATLAQQTGVLAVFAAAGATQTGQLYVAQAIAGAVSAIAGIAAGLLTPTLAAMTRGRREATSTATRVALALASPPAAALVAIPHIPLTFLGAEYAAAAVPLALLSIAALPGTMVIATISFLLAERKYRSALTLQTVQTSTQLALYATLVPQYGSTGVALTTFVVAIIGAVLASKYVPVTTFHIVAVALPMVTAQISAPLGYHAVIVAVLVTYFVFLRLAVVKRSDIANLALALLGEKAYTFYSRYRKIIDHLIPP